MAELEEEPEEEVEHMASLASMRSRRVMLTAVELAWDGEDMPSLDLDDLEVESEEEEGSTPLCHTPMFGSLTIRTVFDTRMSCLALDGALAELADKADMVSHTTVDHGEWQAAIMVLQELISTEQSYIDSVTLLLTDFYAVFAADEMLSAEVVTLLTSNLPSILELSRMLLDELRQCLFVLDRRASHLRSDTDSSLSGAIICRSGGLSLPPPEEEECSVGAVFVKYGGWMALYATYMNDYGPILDVLASSAVRANGRVQSVLRAKRKAGTPLVNLVILPIQRVPRYLLLLEEYRKQVPCGASEGERVDLEQAVGIVAAVCRRINEHQREIENMSTCMWIQAHLIGLTHSIVAPHRKFQHELVSFVRDGKYPRLLFVFSDLVIVTNHRYAVKMIVDVDTLKIVRTTTDTVETGMRSISMLASSKSEEEVTDDVVSFQMYSGTHRKPHRYTASADEFDLLESAVAELAAEAVAKRSRRRPMMKASLADSTSDAAGGGLTEKQTRHLMES